jgi:hypothetical protein
MQMTQKKPKVLSKRRAPSARKRAQKASRKLVPRTRKDLELKNYLTEPHPELGLPMDGAKFARSDPAWQAETIETENKYGKHNDAVKKP